MEAIRWLRLIAFLLVFASPLLAADVPPFKSKPKGHEKNKQLANSAYESNLKKYAEDKDILVLPCLVADKRKKRIEVMVESTRLSPNSSCEFTIIGETSEHGYEAPLTLAIEPVHTDGSKRVKDLVLLVQKARTPTGKPLTGVERVISLNLQLRDSETVLNGQSTLISVVETLASLDRKKHDYHLTVSFGDDVELGQVQALAKILSIIDFMVFAPPTLKYGQLIKFLEPTLPTHKTIHVYLDDPMPPIPSKRP